MSLTFSALGRPETQGSVRAYPGRNGGAFVVQGSSPAHGRRLEDWRQEVRRVAADLIADDPRYPLVGPVAVTARFGLAPPKSLPKRRRTWPIGARSGDLDKLLRAVLDALTGVVWADDSQVVSATMVKDWADRPGVTLEITEVGDGR